MLSNHLKFNLDDVCISHTKRNSLLSNLGDFKLEGWTHDMGTEDIMQHRI